jgi:polyisoprenoid-binding protein YceI
MTRLHRVRPSTAIALAAAFALAAIPAIRSHAAAAPLQVDTAKVSIAGTTNIHPYTAATTTVRVTKVKLAADLAAADTLDVLAAPGAIEAFEVAIPAATLLSPKGDLDKNMHKALKVQQFADITFRLTRLEKRADGQGFTGIGTLTVAGVAKEVALDLTLQKQNGALAVKGELALLMTDYGITPPKAMLGMLKTDPKVTITIETVLTVPVA